MVLDAGLEELRAPALDKLPVFHSSTGNIFSFNLERACAGTVPPFHSFVLHRNRHQPAAAATNWKRAGCKVFAFESAVFGLEISVAVRFPHR